MIGRAAAACASLVLLAACQSAPADYLEYRASQDPSTVASRIASNIGTCWFGPEKRGFADLSYAPELNSFSGRPRVLIVPEQDPGGLPKLVVEVSQAERGSSVKLFGPMMAGGERVAIARDVERWAGGATGC